MFVVLETKTVQRIKKIKDTLSIRMLYLVYYATVSLLRRDEKLLADINMLISNTAMTEFSSNLFQDTA